MLVMLRMAGMLVINPIFGRRSVPVMLNAGLAFVMAVLLTASMRLPAIPEPTLIGFFPLVLREMLVGMLASFMLQLFLSILIVGGEIVDMQIGVGMAKVFDPGTNASVSLTSTLFNAMFILTFFATNNHLTFLRMAAQTFQIIPLGYNSFNWENLRIIPEYFSTIMIFSMKLCLPIVVLEIIVTLAVGVIMRIIPQINVFVVSIQFKLLVGMFAIVLLVGPFMVFFENLIVICFENIQNVWSSLI